MSDFLWRAMGGDGDDRGRWRFGAAGAFLLVRLNRSLDTGKLDGVVIERLQHPR